MCTMGHLILYVIACIIQCVGPEFLLDLVETPYAHIKKRGLYDSPPPTLLLVHKELCQMTMTTALLCLSGRRTE